MSYDLWQVTESFEPISLFTGPKDWLISQAISLPKVHDSKGKALHSRVSKNIARGITVTEGGKKQE